MSVDTEGLRWCDKCWIQLAAWIALNEDGTRTDLCDEDKDLAREGSYLMAAGGKLRGLKP